MFFLSDSQFSHLYSYLRQTRVFYVSYSTSNRANTYRWLIAHSLCLVLPINSRSLKRLPTMLTELMPHCLSSMPQYGANGIN